MQKILSDLFVQPLYDESSVLASFTIPDNCSECSWQILSDKTVISTGKSELIASKTASVPREEPPIPIKTKVEILSFFFFSTKFKTLFKEDFSSDKLIKLNGKF